MNEQVSGLARRIGFRFGVIAGALLVYPFPIGELPKTRALATILNTPWDWAVGWFARNALGIAEPASTFNGSGDRTYDYVQLLLIAILAVIGTAVWSLVDRRRTSYRRLAAAAWLVLRYNLAYAMLSYGFAKILKSQFSDLPPGWLYQRLGNISPMRLLWAFMGYSTPYTVFAGLAEAIAGALLLWRRTATLGAVLAIAVMTNVVLLNFSYDVCVKLYSSQLLITAVVVALPGAGRLIAAAMGRAVAEVPPRARLSRRREQLRTGAKIALIAAFAVNLYLGFSGGVDWNEHVHELYGAWKVDSFTADGVERPPLATDPVRWQRWTANAYYTSIWLTSGDREDQATESGGSYAIEVDATRHTITLTVDEVKKQKEVWTYARPSPDHLVIDAVHRGKSLHVALHLEPETPLIRRGFHWINEVPFNR